MMRVLFWGFPSRRLSELAAAAGERAAPDARRGRRGRRAAAFLLFLTALLLLLIPNQVLSVAGDGGRLLPVYEVATTEPLVAISFDASWGAEHTEELLAVLDRYEARATFFLVNLWVDAYPELTREIALRGHELGLHSATHPHLPQLDAAGIERELRDNYALIQQVSGYSPVLFRPPFGDYDNQVIGVAEACGYRCVQWSVDSLDWQDLSAEAITQRVLKDIHAGDIILLHNNGRHTAAALPLILEGLRQRGLTAVAVSDLLLSGDCYIDHNGVQRRQ